MLSLLRGARCLGAQRRLRGLEAPQQLMRLPWLLLSLLLPPPQLLLLHAAVAVLLVLV